MQGRDIGNGGQHALQVAVAAIRRAISGNAGVRCAPDPCSHLSVHGAKSNALYMACEACKKDVKNLRAQPVSATDLQCAYQLMKELDYGKGYEYAHDTEEKLTHMQCMPEGMEDRKYYRPPRREKKKG